MARFLLFVISLITSASTLNAQCIQGDCDNGEGEFLYKDNSSYKGNFQDKKANGFGICTYANGNTYKGEWKNHTFDGKGILAYRTGAIYAGIWVKGKLIEKINPSEIYFNTPTRSIRPRVQPQKPRKPQKPTSRNSTSIAALPAATKVIDNARDPINIWAMVVGVAAYNDIPALNYTDDDAYKMYAFLRSPEGGGIPDEQIQVLIDENATRKNILRNMDLLFQKADSNDIIIFYFSGHGLRDSFLPIDSDGYLNKVKHSEIKRIFRNSPAKYKLCIADACHAGGITKDKNIRYVGTSYYYDAFKETHGEIAFMLSSKAEEISIESAKLRQSIFTHFLIKGLKGKADENKDNLVTISEVYNYVCIKVKFYTKNHQHPVIYGDYDSKMPISIIR
jgi:hypothetical protein